MKRMVLVSFMLVAVVLEAGCSREEKPPAGQTPAQRVQQGAQQVAEGAREVAQGAAQWAAATKDELVRQAQQHVDALKAKMGELEDEARAAGADAQRKWETEVRPQLQQSIDDAEAQLAKIKESAGETWKDLKAGMEQQVGKLSAAFDAATKELTKD